MKELSDKSLHWSPDVAVTRLAVATHAADIGTSELIRQASD